jgi:hypothetical protein
MASEMSVIRANVDHVIKQVSSFSKGTKKGKPRLVFYGLVYLLIEPFIQSLQITCDANETPVLVKNSELPSIH